MRGSHSRTSRANPICSDPVDPLFSVNGRSWFSPRGTFPCIHAQIEDLLAQNSQETFRNEAHMVLFVCLRLLRARGPFSYYSILHSLAAQFAAFCVAGHDARIRNTKFATTNNLFPFWCIVFVNSPMFSASVQFLWNQWRRSKKYQKSHFITSLTFQCKPHLTRYAHPDFCELHTSDTHFVFSDLKYHLL